MDQHNSEVKKRRIWILWVAATVIPAFVFNVFTILGAITSTIGAKKSTICSSVQICLFLTSLFISVFFISVVSVLHLQGKIVQRAGIPYWKWIVFTIGGFVVGSLVGFPLGFWLLITGVEIPSVLPVGSDFYAFPPIIAGMMIGAILLSSFIQTLTLSKKGRISWLWMITNPLGWTVGITAAIIIPSGYPASDDLKITALFIILGSISGLGIVQVFKPSSTEKPRILMSSGHR